MSIAQTTNKNPFTVQTPDNLEAQDMHELFVDVFGEFPKLLHESHTFLLGPRGSGKSMMFRSMQPDCQLLERGCALSELPFFSVYVPAKNTNPTITDLERLESHANAILNEHYLTTYVTVRAMEALVQLETFDESNIPSEWVSATRHFAQSRFKRLLRQCGWDSDFSVPEDADLKTIFVLMKDECEEMHKQFLQYIRRFSLGTVPDYQGALCSYLDFLWPLLKDLRELPFMPKKPIFILVDDADNFTEVQTMILNSWVSVRSIKDVCFKVSIQMRHRTYRAITGQNIETPHDYIEINIATIYTSHRDLYSQRVEQIVARRLKYIEVGPEQFFPANREQEAAIARVQEQIRQEYESEGGVSSRMRDDVLRYARPRYIASLKGYSKNASNYSYAGFEQLIHLSSGIVRYFLEAASEMFDEQLARLGDNATHVIRNIEPTVQDKVVDGIARRLMNDMDSYVEQADKDERYALAPKLANLLHSLGNTFHAILVSTRTERRVFSVFMSGKPEREALDVFELGIRLGYFTPSWIGTKEGLGKTRLYILTRRIAPFFTLDVTGFAGYLSMTPSHLRLSMENPRHVRRLKERGIDDTFSVDKELEEGQLRLF